VNWRHFLKTLSKTRALGCVQMGQRGAAQPSLQIGADSGQRGDASPVWRWRCRCGCLRCCCWQRRNQLLCNQRSSGRLSRQHESRPPRAREFAEKKSCCQLARPVAQPGAAQSGRFGCAQPSATQVAQAASLAGRMGANAAKMH